MATKVVNRQENGNVLVDKGLKKPVEMGMAGEKSGRGASSTFH